MRVRMNGHKRTVATRGSERGPHLSRETQARALTATIVAEAVEEALGTKTGLAGVAASRRGE